MLLHFLNFGIIQTFGKLFPKFQIWLKNIQIPVSSVAKNIYRNFHDFKLSPMLPQLNP